MGQVRKTINLQVGDSARAIAVMQALEKSGLASDAEFWSGSVRAVVSGSTEDIRKLESRLRGLLSIG
jgi:hypothetical protein